MLLWISQLTLALRVFFKVALTFNLFFKLCLSDLSKMQDWFLYLTTKNLQWILFLRNKIFQFILSAFMIRFLPPSPASSTNPCTLWSGNHYILLSNLPWAGPIPQTLHIWLPLPESFFLVNHLPIAKLLFKTQETAPLLKQLTSSTSSMYLVCTSSLGLTALYCNLHVCPCS